MTAHPADLDERLGALVARARRDVEDGPLPSCQLAVAHEGRVLLDETIGGPAESRYVMFSCTKALLAGVTWLAVGDGALDPTRPVVAYLPGFGTNGKDVVTVEHLLLHQAGFPRAPLPAAEWGDRDARLARYGQWRLNWAPGSQVEYHPASAHWVLADVLHAATGTDHRDLVRDRLAGPLGLATLELGVPPDRQAGIVDVVPVGSTPSAEEVEALTGIAGLDPALLTDETLVWFNRPEVRAAGHPGGGAVARAADMARYLQALLHDPQGLWDPAVLADGTGRVRTTQVDVSLGVPANRSLGLLLAGDDGKALHRGFGRTVSPRGFGHHGAAGQIAWADPVSGLSFCYLTNGQDRSVLAEGRRRAALSNRAGALLAPDE